MISIDDIGAAAERLRGRIRRTPLITADVLVDDAEMLQAARWLWFEMGLAADLSGAAAIAALRQGRVKVQPGERICAIVCGAGPDALIG